MSRRCSLEIQATGRKNLHSQGSEVWVDGLWREDAEVDWREFRAGSDWERRDSEDGQALVCAGGGRSRAKWSGTAEGPLRLRLITHPWSGVARVRFNGVERKLDLYATGGARDFTLDPRNPESFAPADEDVDLDDARMYASKPPSFLGYLNPVAMASNLWSRRHLILQFARRDVEGRYRGSYLGLAWTLITPLLLLAVYTFVFGVLPGKMNRSGGGFETAVAAAELPPVKENMFVFAMILFAGLIAYDVFAGGVMRAPTLITSNPNYVKKVVFPLEALPLSAIIAQLYLMLASLALFLIGSALFLQRIPVTTPIFVISILPLVFMTLGLAWFLGSLGVFLPDIGNIIGVIVTAMFFLSAIFFPIPEPTAGAVSYWMIRANPLATMIDNVRRPLIFGEAPLWDWYFGSLVFSIAILLLGYAWFMKTKRWFSDVL